MAKDLAVFGSSFAAGYRFDYNQQSDCDKEDTLNSWPSKLADKLGVKVLNYSRAGSTNSRVYRKAFDSMLSSKDFTYIVELGPYSWYEVASSVTGKIEQIQTPWDKSKLNKIILSEYYNNYFFYTNFLRQIVSLQVLSELRSIDLYFLDSTAYIIRELTYENFVTNIIGKNSTIFNALDDQMLSERFEITKNINNQVNYNRFFLKETLHALLREKKLLDKTNHPTIAGQELISELLYQEMLKNAHINSRG